MAEDIIIHPFKGRKENEIPAVGIFLVTPAEANYSQDRLQKAGGKRQFLYNSGLVISQDHQLFVAGPSIGAPLAVMTMEKLIALGAKRIILYGWCGVIDDRLNVGDVIVGGNAISGEGTSRYYQATSPVKPSEPLTNDLMQLLSDEGIKHSKANVWSTDAPYREDRTYIERLHRDVDVSCVDMEYSALCAVAAFRKIDFAALFLVSDELYRKQWKPGFTSREFRDKSSMLVELLSDKRVF